MCSLFRDKCGAATVGGIFGVSDNWIVLFFINPKIFLLENPVHKGVIDDVFTISIILKEGFSDILSSNMLPLILWTLEYFG